MERSQLDAAVFFSVKKISMFFMKWDGTARDQQNGHDRFGGKSLGVLL